MKVKLTFEYEVTEADGVGTSNDALACAFNALYHAVQNVDSMDDISDHFTVEIT